MSATRPPSLESRFRKLASSNVGLKRFVQFAARTIRPATRLRSLVRMPGFYFDFIRFNRMTDSYARARVRDLYPCLEDRTATTGVDTHYFYMGAWAARRLVQGHPDVHVDIGSQALFVGMMSAIAEITFVDIRPLQVHLPNFKEMSGSILSLPFRTASVHSVSCLSVAEHIGLGRYGDSLDPNGMAAACTEISRILAPGGSLLFAVPVGHPRVCFNAHRILSGTDVVNLFPQLQLNEFSGVTDNGDFRENLTILDLDNEEFGCGMFWFVKK